MGATSAWRAISRPPWRHLDCSCPGTCIYRVAGMHAQGASGASTPVPRPKLIRSCRTISQSTSPVAPPRGRTDGAPVARLPSVSFALPDLHSPAGDHLPVSFSRLPSWIHDRFAIRPQIRPWAVDRRPVGRPPTHEGPRCPALRGHPPELCYRTASLAARGWTYGFRKELPCSATGPVHGGPLSSCHLWRLDCAGGALDLHAVLDSRRDRSAFPAGLASRRTRQAAGSRRAGVGKGGDE